MKRIFSILLVCAMLFSMITITQAEEPAETITIEYWNADSTKIVMDLSHEVDVSELEAKLSLTENFVPVEFTVEKADKTTSETLPDSQVVTEGSNKITALTPDTNYTYLVKPVDGITYDATYTLTIENGLASADGSVVLKSDIVKGIMVEKLWVETFDNYTQDNIPWSTNNSGIKPSLVEDENGGYALQTKNKSSATWTLAPATSSTLEFADTGFTANDFIAKGKPGTIYEDYNIELDAKLQTHDAMIYHHGILFNLKHNGSHVSNPAYGFRAFHVGIDANESQNFKAAAVKSTYGSAYGGVTGANFETLAINKTNLQDYLKCIAPMPYAVEGEADSSTSLLMNSVLSDTDLTNDNINKISLSIKDKNIKFFANEGYISYGYALTLNQYGFFEIVQKSVGGGDIETIYQIDNIRVTKAREIVFAPMNVVDWNADSTKITVDFSTEVDVDEIPNYLTVTKYGEEIDYTVEEKFQTSPSSGTIADGPKTYVIKPDEGMELGALYSIKIDSGLAANDYSGMIEEEYKVNFVVEKIWSDDFEGYTGDFSAWGVYDTGHNTKTDTSKVSVYNNGGDNVLSITKTQTLMNYSKGSQNFADTGVAATSKPFAKLGDYTVELKLGFAGNNTSGADIKIAMKNDAHANMDYSSVLSGGVVSRSGSYYTSAIVNNSPKDAQHDVQWANSNDYSNNYYASNYDNKITFSPFETSGENTATLSVKNKNIKFFFNDSVFNSYNYTVSPVNCGYVAIYSGGSTAAYVDDIIVTQAKEYMESGFSMKPIDGETDVAIGDEIELTFEKLVKADTVTNDTIKVYADDELVTGYTVSVSETDGKKVIVKFDSPFEYRTQYKVVPLGIAYEGDDNNYGFAAAKFTTTIPDVEFTMFEADGEMAELSEGEYSVTAEIINNKITNGIKGIASICLYDENNKMIDIITKTIDLKKGKSDSINDTWQIPADGKYVAKCYVWDAYDSMNTIITATLE